MHHEIGFYQTRRKTFGEHLAERRKYMVENFEKAIEMAKDTTIGVFFKINECYAQGYETNGSSISFNKHTFGLAVVYMLGYMNGEKKSKGGEKNE